MKFDIPRAAINEDGTKIALFIRDSTLHPKIRIFNIDPLQGQVLSQWDLAPPPIQFFRYRFEPVFSFGPGMSFPTSGFHKNFFYVSIKDEVSTEYYFYRFDLNHPRDPGIKILRLLDYFSGSYIQGKPISFSAGKFQLPGSITEYSLFWQDNSGAYQQAAYNSQSGFGWKLNLVHLNGGNLVSSMNPNTHVGNASFVQSLYGTLTPYTFIERSLYMEQKNQYIQVFHFPSTSPLGSAQTFDQIYNKPLYDVYQFQQQQTPPPPLRKLYETPLGIVNIITATSFTAL